MTEVGRQQRQAGLDIGAFAVPGDKAVNGKGVPCIMKARLLSSARAGRTLRRARAAG